MNRHMDQARRQLIFDTFVTQFLDMANVSYQFQALNQAMIYIKQVERLCTLMMEDKTYMSVENSTRYLELAQPIRTKVLAAMNRDSYAVPELPRRESMLEPKIRARMPSIKPKRIIDDDIDPYTNIETLKLETRRHVALPPVPIQKSKQQKTPVVIQPADFTAESSDDEQSNDDKVYQRKKSVVMNGYAHNGHSKSVQIVEKVQIHASNMSKNNSHNSTNNADDDDDEDLSKILGNIGSNRKSNQQLVNGESDSIMIMNNRQPSVGVKSISFDLVKNDKNDNNNNNKILLTNGHNHNDDDDIETSF